MGKIVKTFLGLIFFVTAIIYLFKNNNPFTNLDLMIPGLLFIIPIPMLLTILKGYQLFLSLKNIAPSIQVIESCFLITVGSVLNFIFPLQAGLGFRSYYLKSMHGISIKEITLNFISVSIVHFLYNGYLFLFLTVLRLVVSFKGVIGLIISVTLSVILTFQTLRGIQWLFRRPGIRHTIRTPILSMTKVGRVGIPNSIVLIQVILTFWVSVFFMVLGRQMSLNLSFDECSILASGVGVLGTINITPGNIGIMEWIAEIAGLTAGLDKGVGIIYIMSIRFITILSLLFLFIPSWLYFLEKKIVFFPKKG